MVSLVTLKPHDLIFQPNYSTKGIISRMKCHFIDKLQYFNRLTHPLNMHFIDVFLLLIDTQIATITNLRSLTPAFYHFIR